EEFIAEGRTSAEANVDISAVAGYYLTAAETKMALPEDIETALTNVMVRETLRYETPGPKNWQTLAPANDAEIHDIPEYLGKLRPEIEAFFDMIGLENPLGRAVAVAKAA